MSKRRKPAFKAVVFDLDGVITKTASIHFKAWKKLFDDYLRRKSEETNTPFSEFTQEDYLQFVDGKPRLEGVDSFLKSRHIYLSWGEQTDEPFKETITGLGQYKNDIFLEILDKEGAEVYPSTKELLKKLHDEGIKMGVASSSKNCEAVLNRAGLQSFFDARVDGIVSARLNLKGKPAPDIFIKACNLLDAEPHESVIVEDAVSGIQAGANGKFGLILGIARKNNDSELLQHGADYTISDFEDINGIEDLNQLFLKYRKK